MRSTCPRCQGPVGEDGSCRTCPPLSGLETRDVAAAHQPTRAPLQTGTRLRNRYRIVCRIGRGGMGEVYRAEDLTLRQTALYGYRYACSGHGWVERLLGSSPPSTPVSPT